MNAITDEQRRALDSAQGQHEGKQIKLFTRREVENTPGGWRPMKVGDIRISARRGARWECVAAGDGWYVAAGIPRFARGEAAAT